MWHIEWIRNSSDSNELKSFLNTTLRVEEYLELSAQTRECLANRLRCTECHQPAKFIRESLDVRTAYFKHVVGNPDCNWSRVHPKRPPTQIEQVVVKGQAFEGEVDDAWVFGAHHPAAPPKVDHEPQGRKTVVAIQGHAERSSKANAMLLLLAQGHGPDTLGPTVKVAGRGELSSDAFFVPMYRASFPDADARFGEPHAFWGQICNMQFGASGDLTLNFGLSLRLTSTIPAPQVAVLLERAGNPSRLELLGGYALLVARLEFDRLTAVGRRSQFFKTLHLTDVSRSAVLPRKALFKQASS